MANTSPITETFYKHQDGGIYFTTGEGLNTKDGGIYVAYDHVFPFVSATYFRPIEEWTPERFQRISPAECVQILKMDRSQYAEDVSTAKRMRKEQSPD